MNRTTGFVSSACDGFFLDQIKKTSRGGVLVAEFTTEDGRTTDDKRTYSTYAIVYSLEGSHSITPYSIIDFDSAKECHCHMKEHRAGAPGGPTLEMLKRYHRLDQVQKL